jgi:hypothetical protein
LKVLVLPRPSGLLRFRPKSVFSDESLWNQHDTQEGRVGIGNVVKKG